GIRLVRGEGVHADAALDAVDPAGGVGDVSVPGGAAPEDAFADVTGGVGVGAGGDAELALGDVLGEEVGEEGVARVVRRADVVGVGVAGIDLGGREVPLVVDGVHVHRLTHLAHGGGALDGVGLPAGGPERGEQ